MDRGDEEVHRRTGAKVKHCNNSSLCDDDISNLHQHSRRTRQQGFAVNPRHYPAQSRNKETIEILMVEAVVRSGCLKNIRGIVETLQNTFLVEEKDCSLQCVGMSSG